MPPMLLGGKAPGDPAGPAWEICNCRCTMTPVVLGVDGQVLNGDMERWAIDPATGQKVYVGDMSYTQWKEWKKTREYYGIIGTRTSTGIEIQSISAHLVERVNEREVSAEDILNALSKPLHIKEILVDNLGRPSQRFIGETATVNLNPETGIIITAWKTGKKDRKKYKE